ncbi:isoprenyl transferase [bacterium]|nr:MAG: isoprenyl transferase [bacterium]
MKIPRHIAIIMDGNGRWARKRGLPRIFGHRAGVKAVRRTIKACIDLGVEYLTLYTFSKENWARPREEVEGLMFLLKEVIRKEIKELMDYNVKVRFIGRISELPDYVQEEIKFATEKTKNNTGLNLIIALNYGGRAEIVDAVKKMIEDGVKEIDEDKFRKYLYAPDIPDPDLVIRTSGEMRISNFLLWEIAYSELWITKVLWPDFRKKHLMEAIESYNRRERRFGGLSSSTD